MRVESQAHTSACAPLSSTVSVVAYLICSLLAGVVLYAVVLAVLPSAHRADLSKWPGSCSRASVRFPSGGFLYPLVGFPAWVERFGGTQLSCSHSSHAERIDLWMLLRRRGRGRIRNACIGFTPSEESRWRL